MINKNKIMEKLKEYHILSMHEYTYKNKKCLAVAFDSEKLEIPYKNYPFDYEEFLNAVINATNGSILNLCRGDDHIYKYENLKTDGFIFVVDLYI